MVPSVALAGVPPASRALARGSPFSAFPQDADVFGQRPKTASETLALPELFSFLHTAFIHLKASPISPPFPTS